MSTALMVLGLLIVVLGLLFGTAAVATLFGGHVRRLLRGLHSVPLDLECPHTGRSTSVRVASTGDTLHPRIVACERFGDATVRCGAECLPTVDTFPRGRERASRMRSAVLAVGHD